jgi:hypothetical protein
VQLQQQKRSAQYVFTRTISGVCVNSAYSSATITLTTIAIRSFSRSRSSTNRGGRYYETNQHGADLLRQAVNFGYEEAWGWRPIARITGVSNEDSYAYQDANFGYNGYYVDCDDYNFYFREGFRRGYEDGFYSRAQYGRYADGSYRVNDSVLTIVLNFQSLQ